MGRKRRAGERGRPRGSGVPVRLALAVLVLACRSRGTAERSVEAGEGGEEAPAARVETSAPPAPRVYEQCRSLAPDYPALPEALESGTRSAIPERFRDGFPWFGFVNRFPMAEVDHHGVFVDFGTAHRFKYTLGNWAMGWAADEREGQDTYTWAVDDPRDGSPNANHRFYFFLDRPHEIRLRLRYRTANRRQITGNLNGQHGFRLTLEAGDWRVVEEVLPADKLRDGENYVQLFQDRGPAEERAGRKAYFRADWLWLLSDAAAADGEGGWQPTDSEIVREMGLRNDGGVEVVRPSLVVPPPTVISYYLEVPLGSPEAPTDPYLGFAYGSRRLGAGPAYPVTFEVGVTADDGLRRVVWSRDLAAGQDNRWMIGSSGSLGRYAGQAVRIDFAVRGRPTEGFCAVWGAPTLFVSPAPGARERLDRSPRNVIVLLVDTLRADHLEPYARPERLSRLAYRGADVRTPQLAALAGESVVFDQAVAPENWTLPSVASLLSGLQPLTHRVLRERDGLGPDVKLLSEFLRNQGFKTAAFVGNAYVGAGAGFERGWDAFLNYVQEGRAVRAPQLFDDALQWIRANDGAPFFLYLHAVEPHVPYEPPETFRALYDAGSYAGPVQPRDTPDLLGRVNLGQVVLSERDRRRLHALYCGEVSAFDDALRAFRESLAADGTLEDSLLVVASDHGEEFFEHGSVGHGHTLFQELIQVPLLFRVPGLDGPRYVSEPVGLVDVAPTIIDLLNLGPAADGASLGLEGNSLLPYLLGQRTAGPAFAFASQAGERLAAVAGDWKLVMEGPTQTALYALTGERLEEEPLGPDGKTDWDAMREIVRARPITVRYFRVLLGHYLGAPDRRRWKDAEVSASGARELAWFMWTLSSAPSI